MWQGGVYLGYIEVKWAAVHKEVIRRLDINRDGCVSPALLPTLSCVAERMWLPKIDIIARTNQANEHRKSL
jgi:hypothetical protein